MYQEQVRRIIAAGKLVLRLPGSPDTVAAGLGTFIGEIRLVVHPARGP